MTRARVRRSASSVVCTALVVVLAACRTNEGAGSRTSSSASPAPTTSVVDLSAELGAIEEQFDARVGASAVDPAGGRAVAFRADERFGYASTIKAFAAAELLRQSSPDERTARVTWTQADVDDAGYSPVTSRHVEDGLTLAELAEAAVRDSDNTATNLVLDRIGGPSGLADGLAELGDTTSRVVNDEPSLNDVEPGETDDTTTPRAFTANFVALREGGFLPRDDLRLLHSWMSGNATGDALVRAGAPAGWEVADKSGGAGPIRNDLAVVTRPGRDPLLVTILTTKNDASAAFEDELVAEVARVVLGAFA